MVMAEFDVNEDETVYYDSGYWNDFDATQQMFNQRIAGGMPGPWFHDYFAGRGRPFARAGCSSIAETGGSSADMVSAGVVSEAVGIDYSEALLEEARREAGALVCR